ncbi:hypothetical protein CC80DRAFT_503268 [Byssothecium circinans]|uniref:Uncharacterized protein n=1 Tax=Byssothecium circinans TaxID=147558 RepID=A0A6A5U1M0_9PLEO|nr:hypothetical protein CC80DRAFT_503268 [Byssothecium circinans]
MAVGILSVRSRSILSILKKKMEGERNGPKDGELIYEPKADKVVTPRGIIDLVTVLGKNLGLKNGDTSFKISAILSGVYDLCNDGIKWIISKDEGCVEDINYFYPSKAKHFTTIATVDGLIKMYFSSYEDIVAML